MKLLNRFFSSNCAQYVEFDNQSLSAESEMGDFRKCNVFLSNLLSFQSLSHPTLTYASTLLTAIR